MKSILALVAFCVLLSASYGFNRIEHKNGDDILSKLEEGSDQIYVILFYAPKKRGQGQGPNQIDIDEKELTTRILSRYPNFSYAKVNALDPDFQSLVKACGIVTTELHESPSVLIIEGGVGVWVHGPQTINKIEEFANEYQKRVRQSK